MSIRGGDGITLHKITECADIKRKKKTWIRIHLKCAWDNLSGQKVLAPSKCPSKWLIKLLSHKKNYVPQFLKQRDINGYFIPAMTT
jgi:hypothetical protein